MAIRHPLTLVALLTGILVSVSVAQNNQSDAFYSAIRANDLPRMNALLAQGAGVNTKDTQGVTPLMYAAWVGSVDAMKALLDGGADPNLTNSSGSTALMMSVTELPKVQLLIARGANVNQASTRGRNALLLAAMSDRSSAIVRALLAAGADPKVSDQAGTTPLHAAAIGNDTETIRLLLASAADVNARNIPFGQTPLIYAAGNGNIAAVRMLLAKGADVNAVGGDGAFQKVKAGTIGLGNFTALLMAAPHGSLELVKTLLDAGAGVNVRDVRGVTPLMASVATDHADAQAIKALIDKGADVNAKDPSGETVLDWARKSGDTPVVAMLKRAGATGTSAAAASPVAFAPADLRTAAQRSVTLLEKTAVGAAANGGCASCHSHNITDVVSRLARAKGLQVDEKAAADRLALTRAPFFAPLNMLERFDPAGAPEVPLNALFALASVDSQPDRVIDGTVANLMAMQGGDGHWLSPAGAIVRPPMGDSDITRTALGIVALTRFGPPGRADVKERVARATRWLASAKPVTGDDRNMQLIGLKAAGTGERQAAAAGQGDRGHATQRRRLVAAGRVGQRCVHHRPDTVRARKHGHDAAARRRISKGREVPCCPLSPPTGPGTCAAGQ